MADAGIKTLSYGSWKSPITSGLIVAGSIGLSEVRLDGKDIYWLEARPQEAGRNVVMRRSADQASGVEFNPRPTNARTRVHEYGGGAWKVFAGTLYFSNDLRPDGSPDRRLYRQASASEAPQPLTPTRSGEEWRYADGLIDEPRQRWIGVCEHHSPDSRYPTNTIAAIDLRQPDEGRVLAAGHDFVSSPKLSPDGRRLAWLAWDHPAMPWTGTSLFVTELGGDGLPGSEPQLIAGGPEESIFQPEWSPDGAGLFFVSDRSGWWNLYFHELSSGKTEPLAPMAAEFGQPQWNFGMSTYALAGSGRIVCSYIEAGLGKIALLDLASRKLTPIVTSYTDFSSVQADAEQAVFRAGAPNAPASIVRLDLQTHEVEVLKTSTNVADDPAIARYFTTVKPIEFPTTNGKTAFGLFYPPANPDFKGPDKEAPPLVVKCHGGPTAAASSVLDLRIQYWTSRGIGVLDVNYGGSTGYGRAYRNRLYRQWGIVDVEDAVHGAKYLAEQGHASAERTVITGGSAGGYTVLAALTFADAFAGGASHFGVSDAVVLAQDTHKFESRYLDWLIGPYPQDEAIYRERSPIHHVERLARPVIFFQGDEDAVVPPSQTEMMVEALRKKGIPVGYLLFAGEQHGFRRAENIQRTLDAELLFYSVEVFRVGLFF